MVAVASVCGLFRFAPAGAQQSQGSAAGAVLVAAPLQQSQAGSSNGGVGSVAQQLQPGSVTAAGLGDGQQPQVAAACSEAGEQQPL